MRAGYYFERFPIGKTRVRVVAATLYGYTGSTGGAPGLATDQMSPQERQR